MCPARHVHKFLPACPKVSQTAILLIPSPANNNPPFCLQFKPLIQAQFPFRTRIPGIMRTQLAISTPIRIQAATTLACAPPARTQLHICNFRDSTPATFHGSPSAHTRLSLAPHTARTMRSAAAHSCLSSCASRSSLLDQHLLFADQLTYMSLPEFDSLSRFSTSSTCAAHPYATNIPFSPEPVTNSPIEFFLPVRKFYTTYEELD